jgi:hypothetical protein
LSDCNEGYNISAEFAQGHIVLSKLRSMATHKNLFFDKIKINVINVIDFNFVKKAGFQMVSTNKIFGYSNLRRLEISTEDITKKLYSLRIKIRLLLGV